MDFYSFFQHATKECLSAAEQVSVAYIMAEQVKKLSVMTCFENKIS
jgi:hypothetical protein